MGQKMGPKMTSIFGPFLEPLDLTSNGQKGAKMPKKGSKNWPKNDPKNGSKKGSKKGQKRGPKMTPIFGPKMGHFLDPLLKSFTRQMRAFLKNDDFWVIFAR